MASIEFTVQHDFSAQPQDVWQAMIDWESHGEWIPATRVEIDAGNPQAVGGEFTGYTGYGPLTLVDRMRVNQIDWHEDTSSGYCEVEKLGPVMSGTAGFTLTPTPSGDGAQIEWFEKVTVPKVPNPLGPAISKAGAVGFTLAMRRFAANLSNR